MIEWLWTLALELWDYVRTNYDPVRDTVDILAVTLGVYWLLLLIRGTRAGQILVGLLVNLSSSGAFLLLISAELPVAAMVVGYVLSVPYNVVAVVGVWRSAARHEGEPAQAVTARVVVTGLMVALSLT